MNRVLLVASIAVSFVAACSKTPPADHTSDAGFEAARRAAWLPHSSGHGVASAVAEPITAPELDVGGSPTEFDVIRIVPTDLSNSTFAVALSPRSPGSLREFRLRVGNRNWEPKSMEELQSVSGSGAVKHQRSVAFSLPEKFARALAVHAGTDLLRLRDGAFRIGAATSLDADRTSAKEVWIDVAIANEGAEPVLMRDPAGIWMSQDWQDLSVVVLRDGIDVTQPGQSSHELELEVEEMQSFPPGGTAEIRICLSSLADMTASGEYEVNIAIRVEIMPLPEYLEGTARSVPEDWTIDSLVHSTFSFSRSQDGSIAVAE